MKSAATPATVDEYISAFPADIQKVLQKVRETIRKVAPTARERISYNLPTFSLDKDIIHFGAFKEHIGLYPPVRDPELQARIAMYRGEKLTPSFATRQRAWRAMISRRLRSNPIVKFSITSGGPR